MPERRDYLTVCNDQGVALTDFQAMFCVRCVQPECSRSRSGGLFETRVTTWQERLFTHPARMSADDPLYSAIAAKRFVEVGGLPDGGGKAEWLDPRALEESTYAAAKPRPARSPRSVEAVAESSELAFVAPENRPAPSGALNTPFEQGTMVGGATAAAPRKPVDPWAAAVPNPVASDHSTDAPIVKAGAKIKFRAGPV